MIIEKQFPSHQLILIQANAPGGTPAPAAERPAGKALPTIKFARQNCVLVLTDHEDNPAAVVRISPSIASIITYCPSGIFKS